MTSTAAALDQLAEDQFLRYRLEVIALDVPALVHRAGGWLYHRAAIGWDVHVMVPSDQDRLPLQILGVHAGDLETHLVASETEGAVGHGLAVAAAALAGDPRICRRVQQALRNGATEVVLWGESSPVEVDYRLSTVQHVPTVAGRAFKRQALAAAGPGSDAPSPLPEMFRRGQKLSLPADSDLLPVD